MDFSEVKILVWDFDGTLYRPDLALFEKVREAEYQSVIDHTGWPLEKVKKEFRKLYKVTIQSATEVTARLCGISIAQAAVEMEKYFDRRTYIQKDERLNALFRSLKDYRHFLLANGVIARHKEALAYLNIPFSTFEEDVTSETVGATKPDPAGFLYIMKKTGLPPAAHLMIGDRELVDLAPAKALGMHTCFVWSEKKSTIADVTLSTVYDVEHILL